jgi:Golgi SNAP receptor complex protein 1
VERRVQAISIRCPRHREILHDFLEEFSKTKANLRMADERQQLLTSVREDIVEHRSASRATDALLRERNAVHATDRALDGLLEHAAETKAALSLQRGIFGGVGSKLQQLSAVAPQINALLGRISRKRSRDKTILGVVMGCCLSLLVLYKLQIG